jgi:tRNA G10  N-methylase Trm11
MPYRFAVDERSYADYASGRVLRSRPGQSAFPVRLAREMFEQARALRPPDAPARVALHDPCCGSGQLLAALGFLYAPALRVVIGSDVDEEVLALARENLRLLAPGGLEARIDELQSLHQRYGKPSHEAALASARALAAALGSELLASRCFRADARDAEQLRAGLGGETPEIVVADAPYGQLSSWSGEGDEAPGRMLGALAEVMAPGGVVALATSKDLKPTHPRFRRARQLRLGPRRVTWLVRS